MRTQAFLLAAVAATTASAANCWASPSNGIYTSYYVGTQLAWNLRSTLCLNYWNQNVRVQTYHGAGSNDCGTDWQGSGICWGGYFEGLNEPDQQTCWDTSEQIIDQCASGPGGSIHPTGGNWAYGSIYTEGGYYADGFYSSTSRIKGRSEITAREELVLPSIQERLNSTGQDYRVVEVNPDMSVVTDITYHVDGTSTDNVK